MMIAQFCLVMIPPVLGYLMIFSGEFGPVLGAWLNGIIDKHGPTLKEITLSGLRVDVI
jgi:hypothetical protein